MHTSAYIWYREVTCQVYSSPNELLILLVSWSVWSSLFLDFYDNRNELPLFMCMICIKSLSPPRVLLELSSQLSPASVGPFIRPVHTVVARNSPPLATLLKSLKIKKERNKLNPVKQYSAIYSPHKEVSDFWPRRRKTREMMPFDVTNGWSIH